MLAHPHYACADDTYGPIHASQILTTRQFRCASYLVGSVVGFKWCHVKALSRAFQLAFLGRDIDITHDGYAFRVIMPNLDEAVAFVERAFGERVAVANHGMYVRPEFVGRLIGASGHNLRSIEASVAALVQGCQCTVYYKDDHFRVRFAPDTPMAQRRLALEYIETRIYGHADYLEERLTDSDTSSQDADGGDWPNLKPSI